MLSANEVVVTPAAPTGTATHANVTERFVVDTFRGHFGGDVLSVRPPRPEMKIPHHEKMWIVTLSSAPLAQAAASELAHAEGCDAIRVVHAPLWRPPAVEPLPPPPVVIACPFDPSHRVLQSDVLSHVAKHHAHQPLAVIHRNLQEGHASLLAANSSAVAGEVNNPNHQSSVVRAAATSETAAGSTNETAVDNSGRKRPRSAEDASAPVSAAPSDTIHLSWTSQQKPPRTEAIVERLSRFGVVVNHFVLPKRHCAFVSMQNVEQAMTVHSSLHPMTEIDHVPVKVNFGRRPPAADATNNGGRGGATAPPATNIALPVPAPPSSAVPPQSASNGFHTLGAAGPLPTVTIGGHTPRVLPPPPPLVVHAAAAAASIVPTAVSGAAVVAPTSIPPPAPPLGSSASVAAPVPVPTPGGLSTGPSAATASSHPSATPSSLRHGTSNLVRLFDIPNDLPEEHLFLRLLPHSPLCMWPVDAAPEGGDDGGVTAFALEYATYDAALAASRHVSTSLLRGKLMKAVVM